VPHARALPPCSFARSFMLPDNSDPGGVSANLEHGVLTVTVPKREVTRKVGVWWWHRDRLCWWSAAHQPSVPCCMQCCVDVIMVVPHSLVIAALHGLGTSGMQLWCLWICYGILPANVLSHTERSMLLWYCAAAALPAAPWHHLR
jgi:hypothetical protein